MTAMNTNTSQEGLARSQNFWHAKVATSSDRAAAIEQTRQALYKDSPQYGGIDSYASRPVRSKWLPSGTTPNETPANYVSRVRPFLGHLESQLDSDTYAAVVQAYQQAIEQVNGYGHDQLRADLDGKQDGSNRGVLGSMSPTDRPVALGLRGFHGAQQPQAQAAPRTTILGNGQVQISMADRMPAQPTPQVAQHQDVSQIRATGQGWL